MLIRPAIGDTDPIRYRRPNPDGQFSGNIIDEAMRPVAVEAAAPVQTGQARARQLTRMASEAIEAVVRQHGGTLGASDGTVYEIMLPLGGPEGAR